MIKRLKPLSTLIKIKVNGAKQAGLCVACLSPNSFNGLCLPCQNDLPINRWCCTLCALPLPFPASHAVCGECLTSPPPFTRSLIPFRYQYPIDGMIGRYKYNGQRKFVRPLITDLSQHLKQHLAQAITTLPEVLIPAPMHPQRLRKRGFNQAQEIAEHIGKELGIPTASEMVLRTRKVQAQRELNRNQRLTNLRGVFDVRTEVPKRVAIVDDVVTTGATVRVLASALANAGARDIQVWALARTPG